VTRHDYLPYGEELPANQWGRTSAQGYAGDSVKQKYTGYERDAETSLNFAEARYHIISKVSSSLLFDLTLLTSKRGVS
jgi:hypothetical protein